MNEKPKLQLSDLSILENAIRVAAERGAFRANEFSIVGPAYDRLREFLNPAEEQIDGGNTNDDQQGENK
jgi:hypothetical protein